MTKYKDTLQMFFEFLGVEARKVLLCCLLLFPLMAWAQDEEVELQIEKITEKLQKKPHDISLLKQRAALYFEIGNFTEAAEDYTLLCSLDTANFEYYLRSAEAFEEDDNFDLAFINYSVAALLNPKSAEAFGGVADMYVQQNNYLEAINNYTRAIQLADNDEYYNGRAWAYSALGLHDSAINDLTFVINRKGEDVGDAGACFCDRGEALLEMNRTAEAIKDFNAGINICKNAMEGEDADIADNCYYLRAKAYLKLANYEEALKDLNIAIKINHDNRSFYETRAAIFKKLNRAKEAKQDELTAAKLNP